MGKIVHVDRTETRFYAILHRDKNRNCIFAECNRKKTPAVQDDGRQHS